MSFFNDTMLVKSGWSAGDLRRLNIVVMMSVSLSTQRARHGEARVISGTTDFLCNFQTDARMERKSLESGSRRLQGVIAGLQFADRYCLCLVVWDLALAY